MTTRATLAFLALALALAVGTPSTAKEPTSNFAVKAAEQVTIGEAIQAGPVVLFPLLAAGETPLVEVVAAHKSKGVTFREPEFPRRRYNVAVANKGSQAVLVLGGTVLSGGKRDRLVTVDTLVPAGASAEIESLPAEARTSRKGGSLETTDALAPPYLRSKAS